MIKFLFLICLFLLPISSFSQEKWDPDNGIYVNLDYGFSWVLTGDFNWQKTIGTERHTVFRATSNKLPIVVFINIQRYDPKKIGDDIWRLYEYYRNVYTYSAKELSSSRGYDYQLLAYDKSNLFGKHALRIVSSTTPKPDYAYAEKPTTRYTLRTFKDGFSYSINISLLTELYKELLKEGIHIDSLFSNFKFTAN